MSKQTYMMESLTRELILRRMEETGETMREAMSAVYNSNTYAALNRPETGLYFQSPVYIYDCFQSETLAKAEYPPCPASSSYSLPFSSRLANGKVE